MTIQVSVPDFAAARRAMIESQLRPIGVNHAAVLEAMDSVPREQFVPDEARPLAYTDRSIPLGGGRFLSSPEALGQLLTQMSPEPGERALVVGAGTGYSAAVLAHMGCQVVALEADGQLAARSSHAGVQSVTGPLEAGHKGGAPYDLILIDGAVERVPDTLIKQLADRGRLGAALLERRITRLIVGRKVAGSVGYRSISDSAVAALPGFSRAQAFQFER